MKLYQITITCPPGPRGRKRTEHVYLAHTDSEDAALELALEAFAQPEILSECDWTVRERTEPEVFHMWTRRI